MSGTPPFPLLEVAEGDDPGPEPGQPRPEATIEDRVEDLEHRADRQDEEHGETRESLVRGSEQFASVHRRIDDSKNEVHRAVESARRETRSDIGELRGEVGGLKQGQDRILQALTQTGTAPVSPGPVLDRPRPVPRRTSQPDEVDELPKGWWGALPLPIRLVILGAIGLGTAVATVYIAIRGGI